MSSQPADLGAALQALSWENRRPARGHRGGAAERGGSPRCAGSGPELTPSGAVRVLPVSQNLSGSWPSPHCQDLPLHGRPCWCPHVGGSRSRWPELGITTTRAPLPLALCPRLAVEQPVAGSLRLSGPALYVRLFLGVRKLEPLWDCLSQMHGPGDSSFCGGGRGQKEPQRLLTETQKPALLAVAGSWKSRACPQPVRHRRS